MEFQAWSYFDTTLVASEWPKPLYWFRLDTTKSKPKMADNVTSRNQFFYTSISKQLAFNSKRVLTHSKSYNKYTIAT